MSLSILTSPPRIRKFLVYDLEWIPGTMELRLVGCFDGREYRCYLSVHDFLKYELTSKNRGKWFYAHAGGLADFTFFFQEFLARRSEVSKFRKYKVRSSFSGSSAIITHVASGKNCWHFVDSYWLLRDKLSRIAESIGRSKGSTVKDFDRMTTAELKKFYAEAPFYVLREYNREDCEILWHAISEFESEILEMGGQMNMTQASTAMGLFRRKYLTEPIETNAGINVASRSAYVASRVEVFDETLDDDGYYFDFNSSFPWSMTKPCPGEYIGACMTIPDDEHATFMANCLIEVPDCYLPPIPHRIENKVFFPVGKWRSWFTGPDIQLLLREGCKIHKVYEVMKFKPFHDLGHYATDLFDKKKKAKEKGDRFKEIVYKLLLNSLYGKFAESDEKDTLVLNPSAQLLRRWQELEVPVKMLSPGAWIEPRIAKIPHMHVPISAHITSLSRKILYDGLDQCGDIYYCDTDSIVCGNDLKTGKGLGELKLEHKVASAEFHSPKVYRLTDAETGEVITKAKGFSLGRREDAIERMARLLRGETIEITRMMRVREMMRKGILDPMEIMVRKRLEGRDCPKRYVYPDGSTRPWSIDELEDWAKKGEEVSRFSYSDDKPESSDD